jgi:galactokinase
MIHTQFMLDAFQANFNRKPDFIVRAPGRVNLIGEHTDYNEGFVLPMAIDRAAWIAFGKVDEDRVHIHALDQKEAIRFELDQLKKGSGWAEYIKGIAYVLRMTGYELTGWEGVLAGDVPIGAGLSSSAAVELAAARAFSAVSGFDWEPVRMAKLAQQAENEWVGVNSGIMDQMVSAAARAGHALFLDCRSLEFQHIPMPEEAAVVVLDTSTRRELVGSAYNERRSQCDEAARFFSVRALRDVNEDEFEKKKGGLGALTLKRARHILTENRRVLEVVEALRVKDLPRIGELLNASHASLRDDFEVSSLALDQIVAAAQDHPGCYGARMTGAGFGGCAVALVKRDLAEAFVPAVLTEYRLRSGLEAGVYVCRASEGASVEHIG